MKLSTAFLIAILICLPSFGQTAAPQQSGVSSQQPAGETPTPNASSNSGKTDVSGVWRKIKVKFITPPKGATAQCKDPYLQL